MKMRLDTLLAKSGLFESRAKAAAAVLAGGVFIGEDRRRAAKPGQLVNEDVCVAVAEEPRFVSRGGIKLANALDHFGLDVSSKECLDVGASTGGFTDCLLQHGASHVVALDVAYGELHWKLRRDPRVTVLERTNARNLKSDQLPYSPSIVTVDVSFISLMKVIPTVFKTTADRFSCLALVKPQFEVGPDEVGKGGVIRDAKLRRGTLLTIGEEVQKLGFAVEGFCYSGLPGPAGNRESFILVSNSGKGTSDLEKATLVAEPR